MVLQICIGGVGLCLRRLSYFASSNVMKFERFFSHIFFERAFGRSWTVINYLYTRNQTITIPFWVFRTGNRKILVREFLRKVVVKKKGYVSQQMIQRKCERGSSFRSLFSSFWSVDELEKITSGILFIYTSIKQTEKLAISRKVHVKIHDFNQIISVISTVVGNFVSTQTLNQCYIVTKDTYHFIKHFRSKLAIPSAPKVEVNFLIQIPTKIAATELIEEESHDRTELIWCLRQRR